MNIPILGQTGPNAPGLTSNFDIHDSEINEIHKILEKMRLVASGPVNYDMWQREIEDRFARIGFKIDVRWYTTNLEGVLMPEINISDRLEKHAFDHDKKVHEITKDILGLGQQGVIKSNLDQIQKHDHKH